jgi:hypothetical protein
VRLCTSAASALAVPLRTGVRDHLDGEVAPGADLDALAADFTIAHRGVRVADDEPARSDVVVQIKGGSRRELLGVEVAPSIGATGTTCWPSRMAWSPLSSARPAYSLQAIVRSSAGARQRRGRRR